MKTIKKVVRVQGTEYSVWSDFTKRATYAEQIQTGEIKGISGSGYISNELSVRKAIAKAWMLDSFRK
jgi:hypothetical protein